MEFFKPTHEKVEAIEVTEEYLRSLPKMGGNPCRLGEQAEIYSKNNQNKTYAQKGDFIVKYEDHDMNYFVVPGRVFKALFASVDAPPVAEEVVEEKNLLTAPPHPDTGEVTSDDLANLGELTPEEKAKKEEYEKKLEEERLAKEAKEKEEAERLAQEEADKKKNKHHK